MSSKILLFSALYLIFSCWGDETSSRGSQELPLVTLDGSTEDLHRDESLWQRHSWKPWKIFKRDSQRTLTRRDSSLVVTRPSDETEPDISTARAQSMGKINETAFLNSPRAIGSIRTELVTFMFESMLESIVESWEIIAPVKKEESTPGNWDLSKLPSEANVSRKRKKAVTSSRSSRMKSRSKMTLCQDAQNDPMLHSWWSSPDERAIIRFKNGNMYEGNISMKCMNGEGRFQWSDGTVYLGLFKDNKMNGKGLIAWKDDTWYQGDFLGNLRHGRGLYVDSRKNSSYAGGWYCGTKHGKGVIYYSSFDNSYDGDWILNVRDGYGSREYNAESGYRGEWDKYIREGKGIMIWPNHDFYRGHWKNGVMSGYGMYIWNAYYNNSMSLPSIGAYRGQWHKGQRNGYGVLNLGFGLGSHYKGEFKNNKKHGVGKFVTNGGRILQHKQLFVDDNLGSMTVDEDNSDYKRPQSPLKIDICDTTVPLHYHIKKAFNNIDKQQEIRIKMINDYIENNKWLKGKVFISPRVPGDAPSEDLFEFEEITMHRALKCYENYLEHIYFQYSTICNVEEEINFHPVMIRLYLWQLYNDCNLHEKGLNLVDVDRMFHGNPEWLSRNPHDPFEKIYYWQFLHSLISVSMKLYAPRHLPGVKPDTILAGAFRTFMENDVVPSVGRCKGRLTNGYGSFVPLKAAYDLYREIGEPHTVRMFLCAVRCPPDFDQQQPALVEAPENTIQIAKNLYVFGDKFNYITEDTAPKQGATIGDRSRGILKLFNFGNLTSKSIISIFSYIFPHMVVNGKIMDLNVELTFYEFFEAFVACAEESIRVKEEELRWRTKFAPGTSMSPTSKHPNSIAKSRV